MRRADAVLALHVATDHHGELDVEVLVAAAAGQPLPEQPVELSPGALDRAHAVLAHPAREVLDQPPDPEDQRGEDGERGGGPAGELPRKRRHVLPRVALHFAGDRLARRRRLEVDRPGHDVADGEGADLVDVGAGLGDEPPFRDLHHRAVLGGLGLLGVVLGEREADHAVAQVGQLHRLARRRDDLDAEEHALRRVDHGRFGVDLHRDAAIRRLEQNHRQHQKRSHGLSAAAPSF